MKLSVILPCFNGAETIALQLEALANQQWEGDREVIVSNNGSTDDSMEIVERYRDRLPNLRMFSDPSKLLTLQDWIEFLPECHLPSCVLLPTPKRDRTET